jgi:Xaa-Pro aminopeptidase
VIVERAYAPFYMHRTSHWIGMDVHDCGDYRDAARNATRKAHCRGAPCMRRWR